MMQKRILIAGIGNIFHGDDAFGVEVVQQLLRDPLPNAVHAADFGIRSYDLALALADSYETAILIDATQQGHPPGTVYLIEPDLDALEQNGRAVANAHDLNPVHVLRLAERLGGRPRRLLVVGCEPAVLEPEDGRLGLTEPVLQAVPQALDMIRSIVATLLSTGPEEAVNA